MKWEKMLFKHARKTSCFVIVYCFVVIFPIYPASYARGFAGFQIQVPCRFQAAKILNHRQLTLHSIEKSLAVETVESQRASVGNMSHIVSIRSCNLAGFGGNEDENEIVLNFEANSEDGSKLVAVTGETGSGKSLLVSKVAELVTGGKATSSLLHSAKGTSGEAKATVEMGTSSAFFFFRFLTKQS